MSFKELRAVAFSDEQWLSQMLLLSALGVLNSGLSMAALAVVNIPMFTYVCFERLRGTFSPLSCCVGAERCAA